MGCFVDCGLDMYDTTVYGYDDRLYIMCCINSIGIMSSIAFQFH